MAQDTTRPLPPQEAAQIAASVLREGVSPERAWSMVEELMVAAESYRRLRRPLIAANQELMAVALMAELQRRAH